MSCHRHQPKYLFQVIAGCAALLAGSSWSRETPASGHAPAAHGGGHGHGEEPVAEVWDASLGIKDRGVELGEYHIRAYYPVQAQKSTVRFVLHAKVPAERYSDISQVVTSRLNKLRDQVIIATRMMPLALFDEPGLESFRRRILMRLKRAVPELEIDDVLVSDFNLEVQSL
jgi:hypothetical protein